MDSSKVEALLEKYWDGQTNQSEEVELKKFFYSKEGSSHKDAIYFNYLHSKSVHSPLDKDFDNEILQEINNSSRSKKTKVLSLRYWYVAASITALLSIGIIFKSQIIKKDPPQVVAVDTYDDPQKAFEETKKALLLLSSKLNQSSEYAAQISKFEKSQEIIKQN